jgi:uncharacterized membrane protein
MAHEQSLVGYPRLRLENLTDGIYSVAMTLLVLDVRLSDDFHPGSAGQLTQGLLNLWPKVFPYLLSFGVLGLRWLASIQVASKAENLGGAYIRWWLLSMLLITCVPFTTIVVGRYGSLAPAIWLYAGNTALLALASWWQLKLMPEIADGHRHRSRQTSTLILLASAVACIVWSLFEPSHALWAFMINLAIPMLGRARKPESMPDAPR